MCWLLYRAVSQLTASRLAPFVKAILCVTYVLIKLFYKTIIFSNFNLLARRYLAVCTSYEMYQTSSASAVFCDTTQMILLGIIVCVAKDAGVANHCILFRTFCDKPRWLYMYKVLTTTSNYMNVTLKVVPPPPPWGNEGQHDSWMTIERALTLCCHSPLFFHDYALRMSCYSYISIYHFRVTGVARWREGRP